MLVGGGIFARIKLPREFQVNEMLRTGYIADARPVLLAPGEFKFALSAPCKPLPASSWPGKMATSNDTHCQGFRLLVSRSVACSLARSDATQSTLTCVCARKSDATLAFLVGSIGQLSKVDQLESCVSLKVEKFDQSKFNVTSQHSYRSVSL